MSESSGNLFIGGVGASPVARNVCHVIDGLDKADFAELFYIVTQALQVVVRVDKASEAAIRSAPVLEEMRNLARACVSVAGPLKQIQNIFVRSAAAQAALGKPPTRSTLNLRHFAICVAVHCAF